MNHSKSDSNTQTISHFEDTKGLICPLPLLRVKRAIRHLNNGDVMAIEATDEGSWLDFKVYCETQSHTLLVSKELDSGVFYYEIRKGSS